LRQVDPAQYPRHHRPADSGAVPVRWFRPGENAGKALRSTARAHLGFIFQSFNLVDDLTIYENVELGLLYRRGLKGSRRKAIEAAMDRVGIAHRARHSRISCLAASSSVPPSPAPLSASPT